MTLLIVDDEWFAVKGISQGMDWRLTGVDRVLEAFSAAQARECMKNEAVDVLLVDIEMPGGSGLELAQWAQACQPGAKILFLTGHANFSYAQQALQAQAFDYLLKPVDHALLRQRVGEALEQIRREEEMEKDAGRWKAYVVKLQQQRPEQIRLFWRNVIDNRLSRESISALMAMQQIDMDPPGLVTPVALMADEFAAGCSAYEEDIGAVALEEALDAMLAGRLRGCRIRDPELDTLLLLYTSREGLLDRLERELRAVQAQARCRLTWRAGESAPPDSLWWPVRRLKMDDYAIHPQAEMPPLADWETLLLRLPAPELHAQADRLLSGLQAKGGRPAWEAFAYQLRGAALAVTLRYGVALVTQDPPLSGERAFTLWVHELLDATARALNACPTGENPVVAQVKAYVRTHLGQDLTREAIAAQVYLHPVYLSRLFKRETAVTLSEYILRERMERAKQLLRQPNVKIGGVAAQVGYPQLTHFCRAFRRATGMSPQAYQAQNEKEP